VEQLLASIGDDGDTCQGQHELDPGVDEGRVVEIDETHAIAPQSRHEHGCGVQKERAFDQHRPAEPARNRRARFLEDRDAAGDQDRSDQGALGKLALPQAGHSNAEDHAPQANEDRQGKRRKPGFGARSQVVAGAGDNEDRECRLAGEVEDERDAVSEWWDRGVDVHEDRGQSNRIGQPSQAHHHRELNRDREPVENRRDLLHGLHSL
jgi:hypothetical protein